MDFREKAWRQKDQSGELWSYVVFMGIRALTFQTDDGVMKKEGTVLLNEEELIRTNDWFGVGLREMEEVKMTGVFNSGNGKKVALLINK